MPHMEWFDDSKRPAAQKIAEALAAYQERHGTPRVVLVNEADRAVVVEGVEIVVQPYIRLHNYGVQS